MKKSFHPSTMCVGERTSEWVKEKREKDLGEINQSELLWRRLTICHNKFLFLIFIVSPSCSIFVCCSMFLLQRYLFCFLKGILLVSFHNKNFFFISESALKGSLVYDFDLSNSFIEKKMNMIFLIHKRILTERKDSWNFVIKFSVGMLYFWGFWLEFSSFFNVFH